MNMKKALVIGGTSGIGLSLCKKLLERDYSKIISVGLIRDDAPLLDDEKIEFKSINLLNNDLSFVDELKDSVDTLVITCGFGRVTHFEDLKEKEIENLIKINFSVIANILHKFYERIKSKDDFYTLVMGSIAGHVASPLFSVYGSAKAGLCSLIENLNIELRAQGYTNRILDVSPGSLTGTGFNGGHTDLNKLEQLSNILLDNMFNKKELFIPQYNEVFKDVITRYQKDHINFGEESYKYKMEKGRISKKPQLVVGYLSGTFDLFHIGHLNLLRRAKEQCDYLIVGVHESGAWKGKETFIPFDERLEIVKNIKYVDEAHMSFKEDSDAWEKYHFNKLFVGDDYKGSERFNRYEKFFSDKDVEIVYFPYTKGTSSTQLRVAIKSK